MREETFGDLSSSFYLCVFVSKPVGHLGSFGVIREHRNQDKTEKNDSTVKNTANCGSSMVQDVCR